MKRMICGILVDMDDFAAHIRKLGERYKAKDRAIGQRIIDKAEIIAEWYATHQTNMRGDALEKILEMV